MATQSGKIATTIYMPDKLYYNVKLLALKRHQTLNKLVNAQLEKWVAEKMAADAAANSVKKESEVA